MKTIFTLFSSLIFSAALMAAPAKTDARPKSVLTIQSAVQGDLKVVIDGRRFEPNDNYLRVQGMSNGNHSVKIYQERSSGIFAIFGKRYEVVYNSTISLKPFTNVVVAIDRFGRTTVNETRVKGGFGRNRRSVGSNDGRDWDKDHDFQYDGGSFGDYDGGHDGRYDGDRDGKYDGGRDGRNGSPVSTRPAYKNVMNDFEFDRVLNSINKEWFESNKMESASHIIQTSNFTSMQVKQLVQLFNFENNKLELAKLAYKKTVDQKNYFLVSGELKFSNSKDDLARYIRSCE